MATTEDRRELGGDDWRRELYDAAPERQGELFSTISGLENEPLYTPERVELDYDRDLGYPARIPFTRGVYPSMYRGRLWTMRSSRASARPRRRTSASATCSTTADRALDRRSTCRR
jgi:methylmalonyl-CoA mutase N-terminal domain/subunit